MLESDFVVGWKNIRKEDYVGLSYGYKKSQRAVGTSNGAGAHNVQIFVLAPDLVVLHALPGFWHPEDLARELWFSKMLFRLWQDESRTRAQKDDMFARLQLAEPANQPAATFARSQWQGFDASFERGRARTQARDTIVVTEDGKLARDDKGRLRMKPINVLVHERMSRRPFVPFADFDIAGFIDYGLEFYDNNIRIGDRGKKFRIRKRRR